MAKTRQDLKENTTETEVPKILRTDASDICSEIDIILFEEALKEEGTKEPLNEPLKRKRDPETEERSEPERKIVRTNGYSNDYYRNEPRNN